MADFTVDVHELENMKHKLENLGSRADGISSRVQSIGQSLTGIKSLANKGYPNKIGTVSSSIAKAAEGTNVASMRIGKIAETYRSFDEGAKRGFNSGRGFEGVPTDIQDMLLVSSLGASKVLNSASMAAVSAFVVRSKEDLYVDSDKPVCTGVIDEKKLSTLFQKPIDQWTEEEVQAVTELYFEAVERALSGDKTMINSFLNSCFVLTTPDGVTCSPPYSHDDIISLTAPRNHGSYNYAAYGAPITARMTDSARMFLYVQSTYLEGKARSQYEPLTQSEYLAGGISSGLLLYGQEFSTKAPKSDGRVIDVTIDNVDTSSGEYTIYDRISLGAESQDNDIVVFRNNFDHNIDHLDDHTVHPNATRMSENRDAFYNYYRFQDRKQKADKRDNYVRDLVIGWTSDTAIGSFEDAINEMPVIGTAYRSAKKVYGILADYSNAENEVAAADARITEASAINQAVREGDNGVIVSQGGLQGNKPAHVVCTSKPEPVRDSQMGEAR